jgi:N-acyl-D-amino-acid deacylase
MHDIIIKNGTVIDGTGKPGFVADLAIRGNTIVAIGNLKNDRASREIDASGLVVSPGFIDVQNHSDSYGALFAHPSLESMLYQGITTIVVGQCGSSLAPLLKGSLSSIQKWTSIAGVNVNWLSVSEFMREFGKRGLGTNLATLVGHATLRRDFTGDDSRPLSNREKIQISRLYERSLKEGAWGISIGLEYSHERSAEEAELLDLLSITAKRNAVASFHLRSEGANTPAALHEILYLARQSGAKIKVAHFKKRDEANISFMQDLLYEIEKQQAEQGGIYFDVYPYTTSTLVLYLLLPEWASEGGRKMLISRLKNEQTRSEIIIEMRKSNVRYDHIIIASGPIDRTLIGRSIAELATNQNRSPEEVVFDLLLASDDQITVFYKNLDEKILELLISHPRAMIATDGEGAQLDDRRKKGLVHPRSFGTTARTLGHYVRDKRLISLENAVFKLSGFPAEFMGIKNRGRLVRGAYADVVVFDPAKIGDNSTLENPYKYPSGIPFVIVNGIFAIEDSHFSGAQAGQIIAKL